MEDTVSRMVGLSTQEHTIAMLGFSTRTCGRFLASSGYVGYHAKEHGLGRAQDTYLVRGEQRLLLRPWDPHILVGP